VDGVVLGQRSCRASSGDQRARRLLYALTGKRRRGAIGHGRRADEG
jgi:hypothetical protein